MSIEVGEAGVVRLAAGEVVDCKARGEGKRDARKILRTNWVRNIAHISRNDTNELCAINFV